MSYNARLSEIWLILGAQVVPLASESSGNWKEVMCSGVQVDSRLVNEGNLFIARPGENSDGHEFLSQAFASGAVAAVAERSWIETAAGSEELKTLQGKYSSQPWVVFVVDNSTTALGELARSWREHLAIPVVAITGSVGKTTARQLIQAVLESNFGSGTASEKSHNNHIGLPMTILRASVGDRWLLLEAGMNHQGELRYLGAIARPDVTVLLNAGPVHLEFFESVAAIADAKCELLAETSPQGLALLNGDDEEIIAAAERLANVHSLPRVEYFGLSGDFFASASDIVLDDLARPSFVLRVRGESELLRLGLYGSHNVYNALAAAAVACSLDPGLSLKSIVGSLSQVHSPEMRFQVENIAGKLIINDAYNANPVSVKASLEAANVLANGRRLAVVLGDMLELGSQSEDLHRQIGAVAGRLNIAALICIGQYAERTVEGALAAGAKRAFAAENIEQGLSLLSTLMDTEIVLFKGSRGMALEKMISALRVAQ